MNTPRRTFLKSAAALMAGNCARNVFAVAEILVPGRKKSDIRIERISHHYDHYRYRVPMKFAGEVMDRATLITVECEVRTLDGRTGAGFGAVPFNHIFSYPSKTMSHEAKELAMKALAEE